MNVGRIIKICAVCTMVISHSASLFSAELIVKHQLDPKRYDPETDPDIDMYIQHWEDSPAQNIQNGLVARDVLSQGDPASPSRKGAVLKYVNRFVHASLYGHSSTEPVSLSGEQEILYILSGEGSITSDLSTNELSQGMFVLIPDRCTFSMENNGDEALTMYLIAEPVVRDDFVPQRDIIVVDERTVPTSATPGHWSMFIKNVFNLGAELSIIEYVNIITFDPMTIGHPHAHLEGCEEVWTSLEGTSILFMGKEIRMQSPGMAYLCPPYGNCTHSNINQTDKPIKLLYFAVRADWEERTGIKRSRD